MNDWHILITDNLEPAGLDLLRSAARVDDRSGIAAADLLQVIPDYHAVIVRGRTRITAQLLDLATSLIVVGRAGVGVDNIDLPAARQHGITVVNTPAATTLAVAELTIGLLFALARQIPRLDASTKRGAWLKNELSGVELYGKTLGLIGLGNIGMTVSRYACQLGMRCLGYDPYLSPAEITQRDALPAALPELYAQSDFITLHIPLTPETANLVGRQALQQMKPGVRLVSTARGGIIDEEALLEALNSGQVAGAALDVFSQEPPGISELVLHPQVIATPHIGAQTIEAQRRAAQEVAQEVLAALRGENVRWRVA